MYQRNDFKQLFFIDKEIARLRLEQEDIRTRRGEHCTQNYENMDMPRGSGISNKVLEAAVDTVEVDEVVQYALKVREQEKAKLMRRIQTVPDAEMRNILMYRYYDGLSWGDVAKKMNTSRDAVVNKDYRFFKKNKSEIS